MSNWVKRAALDMKGSSECRVRADNDKLLSHAQVIGLGGSVRGIERECFTCRSLADESRAANHRELWVCNYGGGIDSAGRRYR